MRDTGSARKIAYMGLMLGVIVVLSFVEHMLPPLPLLPPSVKLGLSNIITMYCVFFLGGKEAFELSALKSVFVLLTRGPMAGLLSFCGGMLSIAVIVIIIRVFGLKVSYITAGVAGAVMHNVGQITAVSFIMDTSVIFYYLPVLIVSGVLMGVVTGTMLKLLLPLMNNAYGVIARKPAGTSTEPDVHTISAESTEPINHDTE